MKLVIGSLIAVVSFNAFAGYAVTKVDDVRGVVGQTLRIKVHHEFNVKNDTNMTKNYTAAETCSVNGKHYNKGFGFSLAPKQSRSLNEDQFLEYPANEKGEWKIEAMTSVANSDALSWGYGKLIVE